MLKYIFSVSRRFISLSRKFPTHNLTTLPSGANALAGSLRVSEMNAGKPRMYWLHSFLLVLITSFGGGWVAPWLIGKPSIPVANDVVIPLTLVIWYLIHCVVGVESVMNLMPIKVVWTVFVGLFRTHAVLNMVNVAVASLKVRRMTRMRWMKEEDDMVKFIVATSTSSPIPSHPLKSLLLSPSHSHNLPLPLPFCLCC